MKKNIFSVIVLIILSGCFFQGENTNEDLDKPITGSIRYKGEGIIPGTSNFYIEVTAKDPDVTRIEAQIRKGKTTWNDSGDFGGTIIIPYGTNYVYLIGKDKTGEIIVETTMDVSW